MNRGPEKIIGVVGGAGPFAGLDLQAKILDQTLAGVDQEHLTVVSLSRPEQIPDRTAFLLRQSPENPAYPIAEQVLVMEKLGVSVAAIPCNTAHAPPIIDVVLETLRAAGSRVAFLNMIEEVAVFMGQVFPGVRRVGLLATTGTCRVGLYPQFLEPAGLEVLLPDEEIQDMQIHPAIYHPDYGIKARGRATPQALAGLLAGGRCLQQAGAEAVILACTELPLAIREETFEGMIVVDPTLILARALIREANPRKLKPLLLS